MRAEDVNVCGRCARSASAGRGEGVKSSGEDAKVRDFAPAYRLKCVKKGKK